MILNIMETSYSAELENGRIFIVIRAGEQEAGRLEISELAACDLAASLESCLAMLRNGEAIE